MLIKATTPKALSATASALEAAVQKHGFGVMHTHNIKEIMARKGVEFERECLIYEVCQPQRAKQVLEQEMSLSTMLPCRISLFEEGGRTVLASLQPMALVQWFNTPGLEQVAREVEEAITAIMNDAAQI